MADEPINHKLLARNKHRGGKSIDKNTSRGKYKKQEIEEKKKKREELAKREQDPNYQKNQREKDLNNDRDDDNEEEEDDDDIEEEEEEEETTGQVFKKHSRSKYGKRLLVQKDNSKLVQLDDKYYNQSSMLNMQSLIDSKVDFIPKFENSSNSTTDLILDELNNDFNKKVNVNSNTNTNTINISEIEKMLSSFNLSKRLNIDEYYLNSMKLPNPNNIVYLKRKSNKHINAEQTSTSTTTINNTQQKQQQKDLECKNNKQNDDSKLKEQEEFEKIIKSPIKDTKDEPPIDNGNVTSDNLEDWLDSII